MLDRIKGTKWWQPVSWLYRKTGLKAVVYSSSIKNLVKGISVDKFIRMLSPELRRKREPLLANYSLPFQVESGPMPPEDQRAMVKILSYLDPKNVFEFGTNWGVTTAVIVQNTAPDCKIYTLDICREMLDENLLKKDKELNMVLTKDYTGWAYKQIPESKSKVIQIFQDSLKLSWQETNYPDCFDVILIDACHKYDYVKCDTENALKKLAKRGLLLWHDYYPDVSAWTDVFRYVNDFAKRHQPVFHLQGTHLAAWIKP